MSNQQNIGFVPNKMRWCQMSNVFTPKGVLSGGQIEPWLYFFSCVQREVNMRLKVSRGGRELFVCCILCPKTENILKNNVIRCELHCCESFSTHSSVIIPINFNCEAVGMRQMHFCSCNWIERKKFFFCCRRQEIYWTELNMTDTYIVSSTNSIIFSSALTIQFIRCKKKKN